MSRVRAQRHLLQADVLLGLLLGVLLALAAFGTGSALLLILGALCLLVSAYAGISVLWAVHTLHCEADAGEICPVRGDTAKVRLTLRTACPLPLGRITVRLSGSEDSAMPVPAGRSAELTAEMAARHVGPFAMNVHSVEVYDLFGLCSAVWLPADQVSAALVLPRTFPVTPLTFAPVDAGLGTMARATEDLGSPADIRKYQSGDPLKRIHWKLSARRRELVVRRYEEPVLHEGLVLLDCAFAEGEESLRDAVLEAAASVMEEEISRGSTLTLPLMGSRPLQVTTAMGLPAILRHLARAERSADFRFPEFLLQESRLVRTVGAVVVITARLNGLIADLLIQMRRLGPALRLYIITPDPEDERLLPLIARLQQGSVEVCYVRSET